MKASNYEAGEPWHDWLWQERQNRHKRTREAAGFLGGARLVRWQPSTVARLGCVLGARPALCPRQVVQNTYNLHR